MNRIDCEAVASSGMLPSQKGQTFGIKFKITSERKI
jgi:hypothetical protein